MQIHVYNCANHTKTNAQCSQLVSILSHMCIKPETWASHCSISYKTKLEFNPNILQLSKKVAVIELFWNSH